MTFRTSCVVCVFFTFVLRNLVFAESNDNVIFPTQSARERGRKHSNSSVSLQNFNTPHHFNTHSIPLDIARKLNDVKNEREFLESFVENGAQFIRSDSISFRSFPGLQEETSEPPPVPKYAACQPEKRTVSLRDTSDPTEFYYPSCTRIERCGGCCSHESLECEPTEINYVNYTVYVTKYDGNRKLKHLKQKIVTVEKHSKCKCNCKIKMNDCTSLEKYDESNCRCVCKNIDEEALCSQQKKKLWDPLSCACKCRNVEECSSGFYFDQSSCSCNKIQYQRSPLKNEYFYRRM